MKKQNKKIIVVYTTIIVVGLLLIGIGISTSLNKSKDNIKYRNANEIKDIIVEDTHYIDDSLINIPITIPYKVSPSDASIKDVDIISSDSSILTVNDDNTVTAKKKGKVTVTLISKNNKDITAGMNIVIE